MQFKETNTKNRLYNYYNNFIKAKKLEFKNILIDEKKYMDLTIYFARYDHENSIRMLNLYYLELIGKKVKKKNI